MTDSSDSLLLDDRQRAMLREMGVQVWQPRVTARADVPPPAEAPAAPPAVEEAGAPSPVPRPVPAPTPTPSPLPPPAASPRLQAAASPAPVGVAPAAVPAAVLRGDWQAFFPPAGDDPQAPAWLVLVDSGSADPREGDAGRLLEAMLRAAGLHRRARVWVAAVGRPATPDDTAPPLDEALSRAVLAHRPAMVLTLGRLSAQAALGRSDPLGRLRGSVHRVDGVPLVVSYEPAYLLRAQDDKARAWEDLCRALAAGP